MFNTFAVGLSLWGFANAGMLGDFEADSGKQCTANKMTSDTEIPEYHNLTLSETLIFSSLISAVDPVAVLGKMWDIFAQSLSSTLLSLPSFSLSQHLLLLGEERDRP